MSETTVRSVGRSFGRSFRSFGRSFGPPIFLVVATLGALGPCGCEAADDGERALEFPLPDDPLGASHPYPAARQVGPDGLGIPVGALEADIPEGEEGAAARALMAALRDAARDLDGAGVSSVIRAPFEGEVDRASLTGAVDVLDGEGKRAPIAVDVVDRSLAIAPGRPWDAGATYVVVVRRVRDLTGAPCRPSAGVRALLRNDSGDAFDAERPTVRKALDRAGIPNDDVCLAFSFRTADVMKKARALRDRVASRALRTRPSYAVDEVRDAKSVTGLESSEHVDRVVYGTYASPVFRDATGRFVEARVDGREEPPAFPLRFALSLPRGAKPPYRVVMGIHGLGGRIETTLPPYAEYLGEAGFAYLTIDGVAHGSRAVGGQPASTSILDLGDPRRSRDVLRQTLADLYQLRLVVSNGVSADGLGDTLERTGIGWSGGSYGGIFGTMLVATDPGIEAAHVEGCGGPWREVLATSGLGRGFVQFLFNGKTGLPPGEPTFARTLARYLDVLQWITDPGDPSALAEYVARHPLDGAPRRILMQYWVGETLMPNAASELLARALDAPVERAATDPAGTRGVWPYDVARWGAPTGIEGHQAFWKIPAARRQALEFLSSHGTSIAPPARGGTMQER